MLDTPDTNAMLVDQYGDPLRRGTLMVEWESYERIIEGHKIAADAARHLAKREKKKQWITVASALDAACLDVMRLAALEHSGRFKESSGGSGDGMSWRKARDRFREGLRQAAGGMRQMATCHRGDINWSRFARRLEDMERALLAPARPIAPPSAMMLS